MDTAQMQQLVFQAEQLVEALRDEIRFAVMLGQYNRRDKVVQVFRNARTRLYRRQRTYENALAAIDMEVQW